MVRAARKFGCRLAVHNALDRVASCLDGQHVEDSRRGSEKLFVARVRCRIVPAVTFSCYNCKCRLNSETVLFCCALLCCCSACPSTYDYDYDYDYELVTVSHWHCMRRPACRLGQSHDQDKSGTGKSYLLYAKLFEYDLCITLELVVKITY